MSFPRIKLVAIAANEAYFLPLWIYHNFHIGFDSIDIYINHTSDNSLEILEKLKAAYSGLNICNCDWIDKIYGYSGGVQQVSYAWAYFNTCHNYDYVMFIDIDEYLVLENGKSTIKDVLIKYNYPDLMTLAWTNVAGRDKFEYPFVNQVKFYGFNSGNGKSIYKTEMPITMVHPHIPIFSGSFHCINGSGNQLSVNVESPCKVSGFDPRKQCECYILHDWMRSPLFNLASINNGDCIGSCKRGIQGLKTNKHIFHLANEKRNFEFSVDMGSSYRGGYKKLINDLDLEQDMKTAWQFKAFQALDSVRLLATVADKQFSREVLNNLGKPDDLHHKILDELISSEPALSTFSGGIVDERAIATADLDDSLKIIRRAMQLYPYATDEEGHPKFPKMLVQRLLDASLFERAKEEVEQMNSRWGDAYAWSNLQFARAYKDAGKYRDALVYYNGCRYNGCKDVLAKISELEKLLCVI